MTEHTRAFLPVTVAALALFLTGWVYWPGQSGPALLDDATSVMVIRDLREQPELAWDYVTGDKSGPLGRPVSVASFVLEKIFFDDSLIVSKRLNICLHLFNGVLLMGLFWLLFRHRGVPGYRWLAVALGAIWLLSPLFVSTVLYIVQRMAMLSTMFMLLACIAYACWRQRLLRGHFSTSLIALVALSIVLAVLAKENAVVVIPVLLLIEALWFQFAGKDGQVIRSLRFTSLSLIVLGALGVTIALVADYDGLAANFANRYFSLEERLLTQSRIIWHYVAQIYAPDVHVMGLYHDDVVVSTSLFQPAITLYAVLALFAVAALMLVLCFWRWGRFLALGIAWFLVGHSVESTVLPLELYFEHRNYFPGIGLVLLTGALFAALVKRWPDAGPPLLLYLGCYALWLASLTGSQVQIWSSHPLLILNHLNAHPESFRANSDMAVQLANQGEYAAAQKYSARAFAVSNGERSGDHEIRDLALACISNQPVEPVRIEGLGTDHPERPFGSVVTLQTMIRLLQDNACPSFDREHFANRMTEIFLDPEAPASASENIFLGLALLENALQRWQKAEAYIDRFLQSSPDNAQGLLMKLHFVTALGKVNAADAVKFQLGQLQDQGKLTVAEQQTLSLYLEN
jgi:protein O-mannosyl-transferase